MRSAGYVSVPETGVARRRSTMRFAVGSVHLLVAFVLVFSGLISALLFSAEKDSRTAHAFDPVQTVMCAFGDDSTIGKVYQLTSSDDLYFYLRSKSAIAPGINDVDGGFNPLLSAITKNDFEKVNEQIIGKTLDGKYSVESAEDENKSGEIDANSGDNGENYAGTPYPDNFNKGPKVNPYDRFGLAGLHYTAYNGEWSYYIVKACADEDPLPSGMGAFYEDRKEPMSTWDEISRSADPRSSVFMKFAHGNHLMGYATMVSNFFFWWNKLFVGLTLAFIQLSFTDIVGVLGIDDIVGGDKGLLTVFMQTVYYPLIIFAAVAVGVRTLIQAARGGMRQAFSTIVISLVMVAIATVTAAFPGKIASLPNNIAAVGQAVVVGSMSTGFGGGNGMCETDVANMKVSSTGSAEKAKSDLAKMSENMSSSVSCMIWRSFAFRPYLTGQFGKDYNELFVNDTKDKTRDSKSQELKNVNGEWVGDAAVPMGGGEFIRNWGMFSVSVNTNAHSPLAHPGEASKTTNGVANDWWRIVDALSNYDTEEVKASAGTGDRSGDFSYDAPAAGIEPLDPWNDWIGRGVLQRLMVSFFSLAISVVGLGAPSFFAMMSAVYSVGIAVLMALMPVMLLFGAWGGSGFHAFKRWAISVLEVVIKRLITGFLLVLSLLFTAAGIRMMDEVGWFSGFTTILVVAIALFFMRRKIMDIITSALGVRNGFSGVVGRLGAMAKGTTSATTNIVGSTVVAGARVKSSGGSFTKGALYGARRSAKDLSRRNRWTSGLVTSYDRGKAMVAGKTTMDLSKVSNPAQKTCTDCGKLIDNSEKVAYRSPRTGFLMCAECADRLSIEDFNRRERVELGKNVSGSKRPATPVSSSEELIRRAGRRSVTTDKNAEFVNGMLNRLQDRIRETGGLSIEEMQEYFKRSLGPVLDNIEIHRSLEDSKFRKTATEKDLAGYGSLIKIPAELEGKLVNQGGLDLELLKRLVQERDYDAVQDLYLSAYSRLLSEETGLKLETILDSAEFYMEERDREIKETAQKDKEKGDR